MCEYMKHNGIDYDVIGLSDEEFKKLKNNPRCEQYKKDTIIFNTEDRTYFHCGENKPKKDTIDNDLDNYFKK